MKNLKKVLALVLAVAMMMGFATFASATDFTDDSDINHAEAIEVMEMIGVISGYPDGSFRPDGNVTRAQMAKMVATIVAGGDDVGDLYAGANTFSDCTTHWARGYIAYANTTGIIAGVGNGRFNPDGNVTGAEAAKMMLCALGYNQDTEEYVGAGWSVNVLSDARTIGLLDGIEDNADMNAALSRDNAAQMMLNALETPMVYYERGSITVTGGDSTVVIGGSEAKYVENLRFDYADGIPNHMEMCEEYFPDLNRIDASADEDMNRPAHRWAYNDEETSIYVEEAAFVYTAETSARDIEGDLRGYDYGSYAYVNGEDVEYRAGVRVVANRDVNNTIVNDEDDLAALTTYGGPVEVYTDRYYVGDRLIREITDIVVVRPETGTLSIREYAETSSHGAYELYTVGSENGRIYTTVVDEKTDINNVVFHGNIADGALVTYYVDMQDNLHLCETTEITGVLSAIGSNKALTIGDETYYQSVAYTGDALKAAKEEQTFAVDALGYIAKTIEGTTESRYGLVLDTATTFTFDDGAANNTNGTIGYAAVIATSNGTIETIVVKDATSEKQIEDTFVGELVRYSADGSSYVLEKVVGYSSTHPLVNKISKIVSGESDISYDDGKGVGQNGAQTIAVSASTLYVFANYEDGKPDGTVTTVTGYSNVGSYGEDSDLLDAAWAVDTSANGDGVADVVFVADNVAASGTDDYVYLTGKTFETADGIAYEAIIKGEKTTVDTSEDTVSAYFTDTDATVAGVQINGMYEKITLKSGKVDKVEPAGTGYRSIRYFGGVVAVYNGTGDTRGQVVDTFKCADTAPVYFIDIEANEPGNEMTASSLPVNDYWDISVDKDGNYTGSIYVSTNNSDEVLAIYILEK